MSIVENVNKTIARAAAPWKTRAAVWVVACLGISVIAAGICWALRDPKTPTAESSGEISTLLETGSTLEAEITRIVRPAIQRTELLAKDQKVVRSLMTNDTAAQTAWLNQAITTATEVDALALFNSAGHITAINSVYADGKPISSDRINRVLNTDFGQRRIVQKCLRNNVESSLLEFQTNCDITPALFDSTGLSVAYSVPIFDPKGGAKIGVISARLRFDRLSSLVMDRIVGGGAAKAFFVTDTGAYFSEAINAHKEEPPIPIGDLREMVRPLVGGGASQSLARHADKYVLLFPLKSFQTLEGGGINMLVIADERWIMADVRTEQLLKAAAAGLVGTLLLILAALFHAYVTARRVKETIGREAEANARLAAIVHSSTDAIIGETLDGMIVSWNPAAEQIFGYTASEVEGCQAELLEPSNRCHEMVELRTAALQNKRVDHVETQRVRKDGSLIDVSISLAVVKDGRGTTLGIAKIARDITRQKRAEYELRKAFDELEHRVAERTSTLSETVSALEQQIAERKQMETNLRDSEERFRQFAENTKDVFWMTTVSGDRILYVSPRYAEIWGRSCDSLYDNAHDWSDAIEPDDRPSVMKAWQGLAASGDYEAEYRIRRPDGTIRWIRDRALPIRDANGEVYRMAGIAEDFTDRKIAEQQIMDAKEAAEAASRAKSEFLAKMSHEIRTPLNGVIGIIDVLLHTPLDARQLRFANLIKSSGESLAQLINDILDFPKIEADKLELETVDFDLHAVLEDVTEMMAHRAAQKGLDVGSQIAADVPRMVKGDPERLKQILINLLSNAIKFTETGSICTCLTLEANSKDRMMAHFAVTDTGIGIGPDGQKRLFKSFSQVDASTRRTYGGTGLGLAIAKELSELMGGGIGVESALGKGSKFWFTIDLGLVPAAKQPKPFDPVDLKGLRVLAVDENPSMLENLRGQLECWGLNVTTATDAAGALTALTKASSEKTPYRLAILDSHLDATGGLDLGRMIKARSDISGTALLILLPVECDLDSMEITEMGFAGHLLKPVRQSQLHDAIMNAITEAPALVKGKSPQLPARHQSAPIAPRSERILLAEDNPVNQVVASEVLARFGYSCDIVDNGRKAVDSASRGTYDLILMDCSMPEMDGFEATAEIRRIEAADLQHPGRRVPIIALTANAIKGDREQCLAAGMDAYVSKPVDARRLIATIESLLPANAKNGSGPLEESAKKPVVSSKPSTPFSVDDLLERCMGNVSTVMTILEEFEKQVIGDLPALQARAADSDGPGAAELAHALKGAAGVLSADSVRRSAAELEKSFKAGDFSNFEATMLQLQSDVRQCLEFIPVARTTVAAVQTHQVGGQ